jgi:hypothetical protein
MSGCFPAKAINKFSTNSSFQSSANMQRKYDACLDHTRYFYHTLSSAEYFQLASPKYLMCVPSIRQRLPHVNMKNGSFLSFSWPIAN